MKISRKKFIVSGFSLIAGGVLLNSIWIEKAFIRQKEYFLDGATKQTDNIKVIQISDLHLNHINAHHKRLAKRINKIDPDLILITGDSIDKQGNLKLLDQMLSLIEHEIPKFSILGNWEYWGNIDIKRLNEIYKKHNCRLLIDESSEILIKNEKVRITGFDDLVGGSPKTESGFKNYSKSDLHFVMAHCPAFRDLIETQSKEIEIDLVLSGHTHGGQITFLGYAPFKPQGSGKYLSGFYTKQNPKLYVSKGIGTTILPIRFGAKAEFSLFHYPS